MDMSSISLLFGNLQNDVIGRFNAMPITYLLQAERCANGASGTNRPAPRRARTYA